MKSSLAPVAWIVGLSLFLILFVWWAMRMIRWAKRRSSSTELLGWAMGLPAAGVNSQPPPQEHIEELTFEIQGRKNSDSADPKD